MSFLSSVGKCKDCSKEYKYAPEYKSSIFNRIFKTPIRFNHAG